MSELGDAIDKIKTQFDSVQAAMKDAQDQLAKTKAEHELWKGNLAKLKQEHAAKISELEAKKVAADRAAEENARRIKLNNDQVAEITRIREELGKRERALEKRESEAAQRVSEAAYHLDAAQKREQEVVRKEKEIAARYAKMKEAMT